MNVSEPGVTDIDITYISQSFKVTKESGRRTHIEWYYEALKHAKQILTITNNVHNMST